MMGPSARVGRARVPTGSIRSLGSTFALGAIATRPNAVCLGQSARVGRARVPPGNGSVWRMICINVPAGCPYQSKVIKVFQWRIQALKSTSAFGKDFSDVLTTLGSGAALKLKIDDALKARGIAESISVSDPRISYQPAGKDYHQHYASHHSRDMISPDGRLHCKCDDWGRYSIIVTWDMGEHCT